MIALAAGFPLAVIVALMLGAGWSAARSGLVGLAACIAIAVAAFDFPALAIGYSLLEAAFTGAVILWIVFPALCIFESQSRQSAFDVMRSMLVAISPDLRVQVILIAWFFALFLEGAAGFGTPVALAAPLLVALGIEPVRAVALALIGHAAGVSFGAIGTPVLTQAALTGFSGAAIALPVAGLHLVADLVLILALVRLASPQAPALADYGRGIAAGLCFLLPALAIAGLVGPELPSLAGALVGGALFVALLRRTAPAGAVAMPAGGEIVRAAMPYLVLLGLVAATRLIAPVRSVLQDVSIGWTLDGFGGSIQPLYHPGTMLFLAFIIGAALQRRGPGDIVRAAVAAGARLGGVLVALLAMLALSRIMVHAGMIGALADAATIAGGSWPVIAPLVGALGTFVTGSATASNILLSELQRATADSLGLSALAILAAQSFGAAIGNMVCPHNIIAGGATVGLRGREGEVLRQTVIAALGCALLGGLAATALVQFAG